MLPNNIDSEAYAQQLVAQASNIKSNTNPNYTVDDFLAIYPQFGQDSKGNYIVPSTVIQIYIEAAVACINQNRFRSFWKIAIAYYIAHFCTLWLRSSVSADEGKEAVTEAGYTEGVLTGSSVDGVSYSMDVTSAAQDLDGYAAWKSTSFGIQLATLAKQQGKGGMAVR